MSTEDGTIKRTVTVQNPNGLHLGPCSVIAKLALSFQSTIVLSKAGKQANAKRMIELATLGASLGDELEVTIHGEDAPAAMEQFEELFRRDFFTEPAPPGPHP